MWTPLCGGDYVQEAAGCAKSDGHLNKDSNRGARTQAKADAIRTS
jgi:hypothetical protein